MSLLEWVVPHEAQFFKNTVKAKKEGIHFHVEILLKGTFPHMVQLLNVGEINQKWKLFPPNNKVTEEITQGSFLYKYIILLFFLISQIYILIK